tara:strand:- start:4206 stop:4406 length:201 start_codon:yes stop_codon:yes gene_type:complete
MLNDEVKAEISHIHMQLARMSSVTDNIIDLIDKQNETIEMILGERPHPGAVTPELKVITNESERNG